MRISSSKSFSLDFSRFISKSFLLAITICFLLLQPLAATSQNNSQYAFNLPVEENICIDNDGCGEAEYCSDSICVPCSLWEDDEICCNGERGGDCSLDTETNCQDGTDNDDDYFVDCEDADCILKEECYCDNNKDCWDGTHCFDSLCVSCNDKDSDWVCCNGEDLKSADCQSENKVERLCNDLRDNDYDGLKDCEDSDCEFSRVCLRKSFNGTIDPLKWEKTLNQTRNFTFTPGSIKLIKFTSIIQDEWKKELTEMGVKLYNYRPENSFVAKISNPSELEHLSYIDSIDDLSVERKMVGKLREKIKKKRYMSRSNKKEKFSLGIFDEEDKKIIVDLLNERNIEVTSLGKDKIQFMATSEDAKQVASLPEVEYVEDVIQYTIKNDLATAVMEVDSIGWQAYGLSGNNITVAVADSGLDTGVDNFSVDDDIHRDFDNRATIYTWDCEDHAIVYNISCNCTHPDDLNGHGTHVTGSIAGNGNRSDGQYRGSAYESDIIFQSVGDDAGSTGVYPPFVLTQLFSQAYDAGARIHTNSWGGGGDGYYYSDCAYVDSFLYDYPEFLITFAAGNEGSSTNTIDAPGTSKNSLTVGASYNSRSGDIDTIASFSSRGWTDDERVKPDVVAPGKYIYSTKSSQGGISSCASGGPGGSYYSSCQGTSMATPLVAGMATLTREYFQEWQDETNVSGVLVKAAIISGADETSYGFPSKTTGWGRVNLTRTINPPPPAGFDYIDNKTGLTTGNTASYTFEVSDTSVPVKVTLVWMDYEASAGPGVKLINDLNLLVQAPNSSLYRGNDFDATPDDENDSINNVEIVRISDPETGTFTVNVTGYNIPQGPQPYALIFYGGIRQVASDKFDSEVSTDLSSLNSTEIQNVTNLTLGLQNVATLDFGDQGLNLSGLDLNKYLIMKNNLVSLNTDDLQELNTSATITLNNLPYSSTPLIMKDGERCTSDCTIISYSGGNLIFAVTGFSNYTTSANTSLGPLDSFFDDFSSGINTSFYIVTNGTNISLSIGSDNGKVLVNGSLDHETELYPLVDIKTISNVSNSDFTATVEVNITDTSSSLVAAELYGGFVLSNSSGQYVTCEIDLNATHYRLLIYNDSFGDAADKALLTNGTGLLSMGYNSETNNITCEFGGESISAYYPYLSNEDHGLVITGGLSAIGTPDNIAGDVNITFDNLNYTITPLECGTNLTRSRTLDSDLLGCGSYAINISLDNVTLDCNGNTIQGDGSYGIYITADNVTIQNCNISFNSSSSNYAIYYADSDDESNCSILNSTVYVGNYSAIWAHGTVDNLLILNSDFEADANVVLISALSSGVIFTNNSVLGNGWALGFGASDGLVSNNVINASNGLYGLSVTGDNNEVLNNNISSSGIKAFYLEGNGNNIYDNIIQAAGQAIFFQNADPDQNTLLNNKFEVSSNIGHFISIYSFSNTNDVVYNNSFGELRWSGEGLSLDTSDAAILDHGDGLNISQNYISFDSDTFTAVYDQGATIMFYNLSYDITPFLLKDGERCDNTSACNISYNNITGTLTANVSNFSSYTTAEQPSCGIIDSNLTLEDHLSSNGTCFIINTSNIVLDGNGYTLTGNESGYGINNSAGFDNITIINFGGINNFSNGIYAEGMQTSIIYNNTIEAATSSLSHGIRLASVSNSNNISSNILNLSGNSGYGIYISGYSDYSKIFDNTINATAVNNKGVYLDDSNHSTVDNNIIDLNSGRAIELNGAITNTTITNNNASVESGGYGIILLSGPYGNTVSSNVVTGSQASHSVYLVAADYNTINDNIVSLGATGEPVIWLNLGSDWNNVSNNSVTTTNIGSHAIKLSTSDNNYLGSNNVRVASSSGSGFRLDTANNNEIAYNNVNGTGTSTNGITIDNSTYTQIHNNFINTLYYGAEGIFMDNGTDYSNISNNEFIIAGEDAYGVYIYRNSRSNQFYGNNITVSQARGVQIRSGSNNNSFNSDRVDAGDNSSFYVIEGATETTLTNVIIGNQSNISSNSLTNISIALAQTSPSDPQGLMNLSYYLDVSNTDTSASINFSFNYVVEDVINISESSIRLYEYNGSNWTLVPTSGVNTLNNFVYSGTITNFSLFAPFGTFDNSSTVDAPENISIALNNNGSINLTWDNIIESDSYNIYILNNRSQPFIADSPNVTGITELTWTDTTANDTSERYYSVAAILSSTKNLSAESVGKYNIVLSTGWNLIGFPLNTSDFTTTTFSDDLESQGGNVSKIYKFEGSSWSAPYNRDSGTGNFDLETGEGYLVRMYEGVTYVSTGDMFVNVLPVNISSGWNMFSLAETNITYDAESMFDQLESQGGNASTIYKFEGSSWSAPYNRDSGTGNFDLNFAKGYLLRGRNDSLWTPTG